MLYSAFKPLITNYYLLFTALLPFYLSTFLYSQVFDIDEWRDIKTQKEQGTYQEQIIDTKKPESLQVSSTTVVAEPFVPSILAEGIELPYESKLAISGRKFIGMKFVTSKYLNERQDKRTQPTPTNFELTQQLQVRVNGTVKRKINVNVDYDDTVENKKDISIMYRGDPDELVQQAAFGDVTLSLPGTEFVSYNKAAFGATARLKHKKANFYGMFSRTKGTTETKRFCGATTFEKKDINDTAYMRRKYYKLALDPSHLPIKAGSEEIYVDDKNLSNNTVLTLPLTVSKYGVSGSTISAMCDLWRPGVDYTIDYERGVIVFKKSIGQNYIIAVDYEKKDDSRVRDVTGDIYAASYKMIKDEDEKLLYELKNYYSIGRTKIMRDDNRGNFVLKVRDLSPKDRPDIAQYPTNIEVDFETGIFRFTDGNGNDKCPFPDNTYLSSPARNYIIYTEYRYRTKSYMVRANIVPQSEKIIMNGQLLTRDVDYFMDYDSGFVTFLNEEKINDTTNIDITYEWMPFGGQTDQTVVGARVEYAPVNNFSAGSTFLYNFPTAPFTSPDVYSSPEAIAVREIDATVSFANLPLKPSFSGEYASSVRNPNIFGNALVENMEGIKQSDTMSLDAQSWKYSHNISADVTANGSIYWTNVDVKKGDINPSVPENERSTKQQVLNISYELGNAREASIIYPISRLGCDYTKKLFLDFWMYGDTSYDEVTFSLGSLNEDADGDGVMDTEDKNGDGILNPGEDVGVTFHHPDGTTTIGADNGKIDTEDLDGDGVLRRLDSTTNTKSFKLSDGKDDSGTTHTNIDWSGWKHFSVPLGDVSTWDAVKQIRLTIKSPSGDSSYRTIQLSDVSVVGNKWEKSLDAGTNKMTVTAINNVDNVGYLPLYETYPSIYEDLYNIRDVGLSDKKEQSLQLKYTLESGSTATTKTVFTRPADYSKHKKLTYYLYAGGTNSGITTSPKNATVLIQFGSESAYYEHKVILHDEDKGWKQFTLRFEDINNDSKPDKVVADEGTLTVVSTPSLTSISQIKVIVKNETGSNIENGEIWLDEIYLDGPWKITGYANRYKSDFSVPGWASFGGYYKYVDRDFQTLTTQISNRDAEELSGYFNIPQLWVLKPSFLNWISVPLNTSVSKTATTTPSAINTGDTNLVSSLEEGKVTTVSGSASSSFTVKRLPQIGASYSRAITESNTLVQRDETNTINGTFNYTNPIMLYVTPNDLSASYTRSDAFRGSPLEKTVNFPDLLKYTTTWSLLTYTDAYSGRTSFTPLTWLDDWFGIKLLSNLLLSPSYSFSVANEKRRLTADETTNYPKNDSQIASLSTSFRIFSWLQPSASYNSKITQTYDIPVSTIPLTSATTVQIKVNTKTFDRTSDGSISISLNSRDIVNFAPLNSLSLNSSFQIADGDNYKSVSKGEYIYNKLFIRRKILEKNLSIKDIETGTRASLTLSDTVRGNARYSPFEFLCFRGRLSPIGAITTTSVYSRTDAQSETTGTQSRTTTLSWPDITTGISNTEKILFIEKYVSDTQANLKYSKKVIDNYAFTEKTKTVQTTSKLYDYRFNLIKRFDCFTSYSTTKIFAKDFKQDKVTADGDSKSLVLQFGYTPLAYNYKNWRFTPRYEMTTAYEVDDTPKETKNSTTQTASLTINYDVSKPSTFAIPFILTKRYNYQTRATVNNTLKYSNTNDRIVDQNKAETYSITTSADYAVSISDNLRFNITPAGAYCINTKKKQDNYYSFEVSSSLTISF